MSIYTTVPKLVGQTAGQMIQDAPLYHVDCANYGPGGIVTVEVNSWRGILDIENFEVISPPNNLNGWAILRLKGPQVAAMRNQFYIQLTPYYDNAADTSIPYVIPVGFTANETADIAIYNLAAGNFDAAFYIYFELGVNYAGK